MVECVGVSKCRASVAVYELSVDGVGGGVGVGCWSASLSVERQSSAGGALLPSCGEGGWSKLTSVKKVYI